MPPRASKKAMIASTPPTISADQPAGTPARSIATTSAAASTFSAVSPTTRPAAMLPIATIAWVLFSLSSARKSWISLRNSSLTLSEQIADQRRRRPIAEVVHQKAPLTSDPGHRQSPPSGSVARVGPASGRGRAPDGRPRSGRSAGATRVRSPGAEASRQPREREARERRPAEERRRVAAPESREIGNDVRRR